MLVCRSVCKLWQQSVDSLYQDLPFFTELDYQAFDEEALKCISAFLCRVWNDPFSTDFNLSPKGLPLITKKLEQWSSVPEKNSINPFPSRHLAIYDSEDSLRDDMEGLIGNMEMKQAVLQMLQQFGHNVWYFTVLLNMGVPSQRYLLLLDWLRFLPNLKVLSLYFRAGDEDFQETVEQYPFPEMEQLTMFQGDKVPNVMLKSVLKANPQIEKVQNQGAPSLNPFRQPMLAYTRVECESILERDRDSAKYSRFERLAVEFYDATKKPTEYGAYTTHKCNYGSFGENREIQLWNKPGENDKSVFTMLERFEGTLVHFTLGLCENMPKSRTGMFSLEAICIDVILPLRAWSLKSLKISAKCRDGYRWIGDSNAITQLHTYLEGRLHEGKIWKLPEIKTVFVLDGCDGNLTLFL